jgi:hypothetical protein
MTIDPGLISVSMDYGFMRAVDVLDRTLGPRARAYTATANDRIIGLRQTAWSSEVELWTTLLKLYQAAATGEVGALGLAPAVCKPLIAQIRSNKEEVYGAMLARERLLGGNSLPPPPRGWYLEWERHPPLLPGFGTPLVPTSTYAWGAIEFQFGSGLPPFGTTVNLDATAAFPTPMGPNDGREIAFWRHKGASPPVGNYIQTDFDHAQGENVKVGDFDLMVVSQGTAYHYWQANDQPQRPWNIFATLPTDPGFPTILDISFLERDLWIFGDAVTGTIVPQRELVAVARLTNSGAVPGLHT